MEVGSGLESGIVQRTVYDDPRPSELDFRQHRQRLYHLLAEGEAIAIKVMINGAKPAFYKDVRLEKLARLLFEWHGPIEAQQDLPPSFKAAVRELKQGTIVESDF